MPLPSALQICNPDRFAIGITDQRRAVQTVVVIKRGDCGDHARHCRQVRDADSVRLMRQAVDVLGTAAI
jgi:hypothetical protein